MVQAAGLNMFRMPGGSSSDEFHFNAKPAYNGQGTAKSMASFISAVGGTGLVTLDYGTGSPQEAAALLAYLNGSVSNPTTIGTGEQWNATSNTWVQVGWGTASYWAGLRLPRRWPKMTGSTFSAPAAQRRSASTTSKSATKSTAAGRPTTMARAATRARHTTRPPM